MNIIICILAGIALATLSTRKWKLKTLRNASLLLLFCGLLFSSIAHIVNIADMPPTKEFIQKLNIPPGIILTHQDYGFWAQFSGHKTIIDPYTQTIPWQQKSNTESMFRLTELEKTQQLLNKYK